MTKFDSLVRTAGFQNNHQWLFQMLLRAQHPSVVIQFQLDRHRSDSATDSLDYHPLSEAPVHFEQLDGVLMPKKDSQSLTPAKKPTGNPQQKHGGNSGRTQ